MAFFCPIRVRKSKKKKGRCTSLPSSHAAPDAPAAVCLRPLVLWLRGVHVHACSLTPTLRQTWSSD